MWELLNKFTGNLTKTCLYILHTLSITSKIVLSPNLGITGFILSYVSPSIVHGGSKNIVSFDFILGNTSS